MNKRIRPLFREPSAEDYLAAAKGVAAWLSSKEIKTDAGSIWPEDPTNPDSESLMGPFALYSGLPGVVLFYIQMANATGDTTYLDHAIAGGRYIIAHWDSGEHVIALGGIDGTQWELFEGIAGSAYVLAELGAATGDTEFTDFAISLTEEIADAAKQSEYGCYWSGLSGISFDAGIVLYLLYAAKKFHRPEWRQLAIDAGGDLLSRGHIQEDGTEYWDTITMPGLGIDNGGQMPNYMYGTAGMAYSLAKLYEKTGEDCFLEAAERGASYMRSISTVENGNALTPFILPNPDGVYFIGLCNGFTGTIRLFYQLYHVTEKEIHRDFLEQMVRGVLSAGAPEIHFPGYWNTVCLCCGTSGLVNVFLGLWAALKEEKYLILARRAGKYMLGQLTQISDTEMCWYQAWHRVNPRIVDARTGYFDGNLGAAAQMADLYSALNGTFHPIRLPDDPYPTTL